MWVKWLFRKWEASKNIQHFLLYQHIQNFSGFCLFASGKFGHKSCRLNFTTCPSKVENMRFDSASSITVEDSGMWLCVIKCVVPTLLKVHLLSSSGSSIARYFFKTSGTTWTAAQCFNQGDLKLWYYCCRNLESYVIDFLFLFCVMICHAASSTFIHMDTGSQCRLTW